MIKVFQYLLRDNMTFKLQNIYNLTILKYTPQPQSYEDYNQSSDKHKHHIFHNKKESDIYKSIILLTQQH